MRRTSLHIILPLVALLWLLASASCSDHSAMRQLEAVEAILDEAPADARTRLDSIDASALQGEARALYAMLKTQADYKCYVDIASDSLIREATAWYGTRRKSWRAAMSWYSLGCVSDLCGNDTTAIDAYLKALSLFPDTLVRQYVLCEQNIGKLHIDRLMYDDAAKYFKMCMQNSFRLGDITTGTYARYNLGLCNMYMHKYAAADSIYNDMLEDVNVPIAYKNRILLQKSKISLYHNKDIRCAIMYIDDYLKTVNNPENSGAGFSLKGNAYYELNVPDSAYIYYKRSMECTPELYTVCNNAGRLARLAATKGNSDECLYYLGLYEEMMDSVFSVKYVRGIEDIVQNHKTELMRNNLRNRQTRFVIICIFFLIVFVLSLILAFMARKRREQQRIIQQQENIRKSSIEILQAKVSELQNDTPQAREAILELYRHRLTYCYERFRKAPEFKALLAVKANIPDSASNSQTSAIIRELKVSYIETIQDIHTEMPSAKEADFITLVLSSLGCTNEQVSLLTGNVTPDAIRKRKHKISQNMPEDYYSMIVNYSCKK